MPFTPVFSSAFQSSPTPKGRSYGSRRPGCNPSRAVSILTHPEGQVLSPVTMTLAQLAEVSILTRHEGQVLRTHLMRRSSPPSFQSSPAPKGRSYTGTTLQSWRYGWFQSSPSPKGRCYRCPGARCAPKSRFNPHPPRRAGATKLCRK